MSEATVTRSAAQAHRTDLERERAFWDRLTDRRLKRSKAAQALLPFRWELPDRILAGRKRFGRRNPDDDWRYFVLKASASTKEGLSDLIRWAEHNLPGLSAWRLPQFDALDELYDLGTKWLGARLTNLDVGELMDLTRAEMRDYRLCRRAVTPRDLDAETKRAETLDRKKRRREAEAKWRRKHGRPERALSGRRGRERAMPLTIKDLKPWRYLHMSRATWWRRAKVDELWKDGTILSAAMRQRNRRKVVICDSESNLAD